VPGGWASEKMWRTNLGAIRASYGFWDHYDHYAPEADEQTRAVMLARRPVLFLPWLDGDRRKRVRGPCS
jgi:hypothetical protein